MQIKTSQKTPEFNPVELTIVFNTKEELHSFFAMCGRDVTVSECIKAQEEYRFDRLISVYTLRSMLMKCYNELMPYT